MLCTQMASLLQMVQALTSQQAQGKGGHGRGGSYVTGAGNLSRFYLSRLCPGVRRMIAIGFYFDNCEE